jgi:DNA-binding NarL/FixJ family response regulator
VVEPRAVKSAICSAPDAAVSPTSSARRILLAGEPRLYLQALSELLDSFPGVSASLAQPGETDGGSAERRPELILLGCPATSEPLQLSGSLRESYPGVPLVLLDSGPARDCATRTASLSPTTRLSTNIPVRELVKRLCDGAQPCDGAKPIVTGTKRHSPRSETRSERPLSSLSERELSVLRLFVSGSSNDDIAEALGISRHTVRTHLQNVMSKMLVRSKTELASVAMRSGIRPATGPVTQDG